MHVHHNKAFTDAHAPVRAPMQALLRGASERDHRAWSTLLHRFAPLIRTVARSHRLDTHRCEDVVQQTWLRLLMHGGSVRDPEKLGAWLRTTARRESLRAIARGRHEECTDPALLPPVADFDCHDRLEEQDRKEALTEALEALPERWKELMHLLLREPEPSYAEISAELGIPTGSIGPTRARCLERLSGHAGVVSVVQA